MNETITERAHGRVNLIGEHTDYNGGWVLPTAIPQYTEVTLKKNNTDRINVVSSADPKSGKRREVTFHINDKEKTGTWVDYLIGATQFLSEKAKFPGFHASIHSTIPEGSGLSSSAALEISFLKAIRNAFQLPVSDQELARLGQRVENEFVGARVGIMDQMACTLARHGEALFLDTLKLTYERITLPMEDIDLLVINSGISHRLSDTGGYNERRAQCEEAAKILGVELLRYVQPEELMNDRNLPELLYHRARHVVTENERVFKAVDAIKKKDYETLGRLFIESHASMRDDYQVSLPEIDLLVELSLKEKGVYGARLTGGGFGGSIIVLTKKGEHDKVARNVVKEYGELTSEKATVLA